MPRYWEPEVVRDPYIGKLMAMGAIKEHGPVTLLSVDEIPDDALIVPMANDGSPNRARRESSQWTRGKGTLYDLVSKYFGKKVYAFMPMEAGGSTACSHRMRSFLGLPCGCR